jgi:hypothetical protein
VQQLRQKVALFPLDFAGNGSIAVGLRATALAGLMALTSAPTGLAHAGACGGDGAMPSPTKEERMFKPKKTGRSNHGPKKPAPTTTGRTVKGGAKRKAKGEGRSAKRSDTKLATILAMLRQPKGASIEDIAKAIGWQAHSVRGVISGSIKKKLGLAVASEKIDGERRYHVTKA